MSAVSQIMRPNSLNHYVQKKIIEGYSYNMNDLIGTGYSSQVFKGKHDDTDKTIAIKVIDMRKISNEVNKFLLKNEIAVLKKIAHKNCLKLLEVFQTSNNTYIITEFCNNGDLKNLIQKHKNIPEDQAVKIMKHILNGYKDLFQKQIIHRDIKPANIFMQDGVPKIADFGFAKDLTAVQCKAYYNVGSPLYMSPETLKNNTYSYKGDIWSLGVLFYELLTGVTPWVANTEQDLLRKLTNNPLNFPTHIKISSQTKEFIRGCLQFDHNKRFSPEQMLEHPLIKLGLQKQSISRHQDDKENIYDPKTFDLLKKYDIPSENSSQIDEYLVKNDYNIKTLQDKNIESNFQFKITKEQQKKAVTSVIQTKYQNDHRNDSRDNLFREKSNDVIRKNSKRSEFSEKRHHLLQHERVKTQKSVDACRHQKMDSKSLQSVQNIDSLIVTNHNKLPKKYQNIGKSISGESKDNKNNDKILISQINYCRFLYKLSNFVERSGFYSDIIFKKLNYLLFKNIMIKITKLKDLSSQKNVFQLQDFDIYSQTNQFTNIMQVINEYFYKFYNAFQQKNKDKFTSNQQEFNDDPSFSKVYNKNFDENQQFYFVLQKYLRYTIHKINRGLKQDIFDEKKEKELILLDYAVTWFQIVQIIIDNENDYLYFQQNSQIDQIAEGKPVKLNQIHYNQIRNKIYSLEI